MKPRLKQWVFFLFFAIIAPFAVGQNPDVEIVKRVADYVIENASFSFIDQSDGTVYKSSEGLPVKKDIKIESQYNYWQYPNGVIHLAMMELYKFTGDSKYRDFPISNYDFFFKNIPFLQKMYEEGYHGWDFYLFFRRFKLDDCGALAAGLIDVYQYDSRSEYLEYIEMTEHMAMVERYRLEDETWAKKNPYESTIWLDDLFMGVPFLAKLGKMTGEWKYFDFAVKQVVQFDNYLYEPGNGLYYHNYYTDLNRPGLAHWGRANGWGLLAKVLLLEYLPENHPDRQIILDLYDKQVLGLSRHQSQTGLWHQLLDKNDSYLETSCSAMFTYAIAKGVNEGWLDYRYYRVALEGWKGLQTKIDEQGAILDVCEQTPTSDDLVFYYNKPAPFNEFHGTGAIIFAGIEMAKLKEQRRLLRNKNKTN